MTDKRTVKMWDLVKALKRAGIHAADCPYFGGIDLPGIQEDAIPCNCWCNSDQPIVLAVME